MRQVVPSLKPTAEQYSLAKRARERSSQLRRAFLERCVLCSMVQVSFIQQKEHRAISPWSDHLNIARISTLLILMLACAASGRAQLQYTPLPTPCRAIDTRVTGGPIAADIAQTFNPAGGACSIPNQGTGAIAYSMNVTVVPHGPLGYLTVWPTGESQPVVSTLNSQDGRVKANAGIVTGGSGGDISVYASNTTDVVLDVAATSVPIPRWSKFLSPPVV